MPSKELESKPTDVAPEVEHLVDVLGDTPTIRFLGALLSTYPEPTNVITLCRLAGVGSRNTFYKNEDHLAETGLVETNVQAGQDRLRLVGDDDPRHFALKTLASKK